MNKNKKNILIVYTDLGDGGIQRLISVSSTELQNKYNLTLLLFRDIKLFSFSGEIIQHNIEMKSSIFSKIGVTLSRMRKLGAVLKEKNYDLVLSHSLNVHVSTLLAKFVYRFSMPLVCVYHSNIHKKIKSMGLIRYVVKFVNIRFIKYASGFIGVSEGVKQQLIQLGAHTDKCIAIPNPVDIKSIVESAKAAIAKKYQKLFSRKKTIITVGRLVEAKNIPLLLDSFKDVLQQIDCNLIIIGSGDLYSQINAKIAAMSLQQHVHMLGWQTNPFALINASDLFVLSSKWEGFGNVIIEAMACKVPVVATDCPYGPGDIITNEKNGLLVESENKEQLTNAMLQALTDSSKAKVLKKNGYLRSKDFSAKTIARMYTDFFEKIMQGEK